MLTLEQLDVEDLEVVDETDEMGLGVDERAVEEFGIVPDLAVEGCSLDPALRHSTSSWTEEGAVHGSCT